MLGQRVDKGRSAHQCRARARARARQRAHARARVALLMLLRARARRHIRVIGRRPNRARVRLDWETHVAGLSSTEFRRLYRLSWDNFNMVLDTIRPALQTKACDPTGAPISAEIKLAATLRFLAGSNYLDIGLIYGINGRSTFYKLLWDVVAAINNCEDFDLPLLRGEEGERLIDDEGALRGLAREYGRRTVDENHPHGVFYGCIGAIDGLAVKIEKPRRNPSQYYCRKGFYR